MVAYNTARGMVEDTGRLNRAFGIAQSKTQEHITKYNTTLTGCSCPDHYYRKVHCKGMLALALIQAAG